MRLRKKSFSGRLSKAQTPPIVQTFGVVVGRKGGGRIFCWFNSGAADPREKLGAQSLHHHFLQHQHFEVVRQRSWGAESRWLGAESCLLGPPHPRPQARLPGGTPQQDRPRRVLPPPHLEVLPGRAKGHHHPRAETSSVLPTRDRGFISSESGRRAGLSPGLAPLQRPR